MKLPKVVTDSGDAVKGISADVEFTYSIKWSKTDTAFRDRYDRYLNSSAIEFKVNTTFFLLKIIIIVI